MINQTDYRPAFWRTFKRAVADIYDRLGLVMIASGLWLCLGVVPAVVVLWLSKSVHPFPLAVGGFAYYTFVGGPVLAGTFYLAGNIVSRQDPVVLDLLTGARRFLFASWKLAAAQLLITAILITDTVFFLATYVGAKNAVFIPLTGLAFYAMLFWGTMVIYQWPLLIAQQPSTLKLIYRSFLIAADNVTFTSAFWFAIILLSILCVFPPGMALLYMGSVSIIATNALREVFRKYGLVAVEPDVVEDKGWPLKDGKKRGGVR